MDRELLLTKIKAAEKQARDRRVSAEKQAAEIIASAKIESAHISENAEKDGRCNHRDAVDQFKEKSNARRALRIKEAEESGKKKEALAASRFPLLIETVSKIFDSEFDV